MYIIDSHKLAYHKKRVEEWLRRDDCHPISIEIGVTSRCNHNCIFCGLDQILNGIDIDSKVLYKNLEDIGKNTRVKSICYSGAGEPFLYNDFCNAIRETKKQEIDVAFSTNAALFYKEKAKKTLPYITWMKASIDAATPETHSKIHRTTEKDFPKILRNLEDAVKIKKDNKYSATLGMQFLLLNQNINEVIPFIKICKNIGVDNVQIKPYYPNPYSINKLEPNYNFINELKENANSLSTENFKVIFRSEKVKSISSKKEYPICFGLPFFAVINEKGNVQPCLFHYDSLEFTYGNIYNNSFSEIWKSQQRKGVIKKLKEIGVDNCKSGCRLDDMNKWLQKVKQNKKIPNPPNEIPEHINFT